MTGNSTVVGLSFSSLALPFKIGQMTRHGGWMESRCRISSQSGRPYQADTPAWRTPPAVQASQAKLRSSLSNPPAIAEDHQTPSALTQLTSTISDPTLIHPDQTMPSQQLMAEESPLDRTYTGLKHKKKRGLTPLGQANPGYLLGNKPDFVALHA